MLTYNFKLKKFEIQKDQDLFNNNKFFISKTDWFVIKRVLSPRKMRRLFGENSLFEIPWIEYFICYNPSPEAFLNQEITSNMRKLAQLNAISTTYVPESDFKKYIKYLNYPKVVDIPKIEVSF